MRMIILLLAVASIVAAEPKPLPREEFTLTDGRTLTGVYDEDAQTLTLDGGKMALALKPEQIKERKAKPIDTLAALNPEAPKPDAKTMTPEEKAAAVEAFKVAQKEEARRRELAEADKMERDADRLVQQAKDRRAQAERDAQAFRKRAQQEGGGASVKRIMSEPVSTRTGASNGAILGLMETAEKLEGQARELRAKAVEKRAAAP